MTAHGAQEWNLSKVTRPKRSHKRPLLVDPDVQEETLEWAIANGFGPELVYGRKEGMKNETIAEYAGE